jgi:hypothetical protein
MDHCHLLFFGANEIESVHVYGKNLMTEIDYQGHIYIAMVGEEQNMCILLSSTTRSIANCKTCTYSADTFLLSYVILKKYVDRTAVKNTFSRITE